MVPNPVDAVVRGDLAALRARLDAGGDPNAETLMGTPIHVAAKQGRAEMVRLLIARGADVEAGNVLRAPLDAAVRAGHVECATALLEAGARPRSKRPPESLLVLAAHQRARRWSGRCARRGTRSTRAGPCGCSTRTRSSRAIRTRAPRRCWSRRGSGGVEIARGRCSRGPIRARETTRACGRARWRSARRWSRCSTRRWPRAPRWPTTTRSSSSRRAWRSGGRR